MTHPKTEVIRALRKTIDRLNSGANYKWTHQGACNCGHLAQSLTNLDKAELHRFALEKSGDWTEHVVEYCPDSSYPIDQVITIMLDAGFGKEEIRCLETLSDPKILKRMPLDRRNNLRRNDRGDLVYYLETWLGALDEEFGEVPENQTVPTAETIAL